MATSTTCTPGELARLLHGIHVLLPLHEWLLQHRCPEYCTDALTATPLAHIRCWNHGYVPPTPTDALPVSVEIVFSTIGQPCPTEAQFAAALVNLTASLQAVIPCLASIRYGNFACQGPVS